VCLELTVTFTGITENVVGYPDGLSDSVADRWSSDRKCYVTRACERSLSGAGQKSGGVERSMERAWQKTMEREREVAERGLRK